MFRGVPDGDAGTVTTTRLTMVRVVIAARESPFINRNKVSSNRLRGRRTRDRLVARFM